jgi:hypothetical protein
MLAFAPFYAKKLRHQLVESAHRNQLKNRPVFIPAERGRANLGTRISKSKPDSLADRLRSEELSSDRWQGCSDTLREFRLGRATGGLCVRIDQ